MDFKKRVKKYLKESSAEDDLFDTAEQTSYDLTDKIDEIIVQKALAEAKKKFDIEKRDELIKAKAFVKKYIHDNI